jgi:hypothetical protein
VGERAGVALEHEEARGVALGQRLLGHELGGELEVVGAGLEAERVAGQNSFFWGPLAGAESGTARPRCS